MNTKARLKALEQTGGANIPRCVAKMHDGDVKTFDGLSAMMPFLDGRIVHVACDDADVAGLLRALDAEHKVTIEIVANDGDRLTRTKI